ncbi:MAG: hypothetical protein HY516_05460 [Candidatus Aenigmarchaeota archaeon]|nr:hypothetical protein [Candidatus Aenigmarchaeota archaeon]
MGYKQIFDYYSRGDVQNALLEVSKNREVAGIFKTGSFGQRPNMLVYPEDIVSMVRSGTVSFHGSVERWDNPMSLRPGMGAEELSEVRTGFELIIDPDVKSFDFAKIITKVFLEELRSRGIKNIGLKYTGGKGFHVAVPFESFPKRIDYKPAKMQYPVIPQIITAYLKEKARRKIADAILRYEPNIDEIARKIQAEPQQLISEEGLDVYKIVTEVGLFTSRHMFRLPYSLHESSLLVSLPMKISDIDKFEKTDAEPDKVKVKEKFLKFESADSAEMEALIIEAMDWHGSRAKEEEVKRKFIITNSDKIPAEFFPPSIKKIMSGLADGRKRSVLILFNFLRNMNWTDDEIENSITEWNGKNTPPLPSNYIRSQMRWLRNSRKMLPPNFENENFYKSMGIDCSAETGAGCRNPVTYASRSFRAATRKAVKKPAKKRSVKDDDEYVSE